MRALPALVFGFVIGAILSFQSCGTPPPRCQASNCNGCCTSAGTCNVTPSVAACGLGAANCVACATGSACVQGSCKSGGTGGGTAGVGGGTAGVGGGAAGVGGGTAGVGGGTAGVGGGTAGTCGGAAAVDHLILSEVRTQPTAAEAIEIYNPTSATIDLSNYRIYNATYISADGMSDCHYYSHAPVPADGGICGVAFADFDIQFPSGATIAAGQVQVIAIMGAGLFCDAGLCGTSAPNYEIPPSDGGGTASVPDMRGLYDPKISATANGFLSNTSEDVVLYQWDGVSPTVKDVDYFIYGPALVHTDKTGVSGYQPDTAIAQQFWFDGGTTTATSYQRICNNEQGETKTGGNGITGHNETSENPNTNWIVAPHSVGAKNPGSAP